MLDKIENVIKDLKEVTQEIKTLKKRETAYKAWLRKFKQENEELIQTNNALCKQRDDALTELSIKQAEIFRLSQEDNLEHKKVNELMFANKIVCKQRDEALKELSVKRAELLKSLQEAKQAKQERDRSINNLDEVIIKLEAYQKVCEKVKNQISDNDRSLASELIKKAEKLLFEDETTSQIEIELDPKHSPQMFTNSASINRSLLDR
ncbi:MAG: hypothetical protein ACRC2R_01945 [Xenococcaceae cyanobacterium]